MIDWSKEWGKIREEALAHNVDPFFIAAIRKVENGNPGREFGVLSEKADTYDEQLSAACATLRNRIIGYTADPGGMFAVRFGKLATSDAFIRTFGKGWAPAAAPNDPQHLNRFWIDDFTEIYNKFLQNGGPI